VGTVISHDKQLSQVNLVRLLAISCDGRPASAEVLSATSSAASGDKSVSVM
jgi:hypothetical protein